MNCGLRIAALTLILLLIVSFTAGCTYVRTADTHNTTVAVQSFNTWAAGQKELDAELRGTTATIGDHITTYNTEIAKDRPDYALIRQNLAEDRQYLDRWGSRLDTLSAATDRFEQETSPLVYENATETEIKDHLAVMTQYMKIYAMDLGNARQYLIEYVNNAEAYVAPDDPEYWNENFRRDALTATTNAAGAMDQGDAALNDLLREAKELETLQ
jgi:hypothetical protein